MSVLIKGMEIPEKCGKCRFATAFECQVTKNFITTFNVRQVDCPLVPVPPHGRLVDADEMYEEFALEGQRSTRYKLGEAWELNGKEIRRAIYRLPTVIPASEEAE